MRKIWSDEAWEDYLYWQEQDKKTLKKINSLIKDIERNGLQGIELAKVPSFLYYRLYRKVLFFILNKWCRRSLRNLVVVKYAIGRNKEAFYDYR